MVEIVSWFDCNFFWSSSVPAKASDSCIATTTIQFINKKVCARPSEDGRARVLNVLPAAGANSPSIKYVKFVVEKAILDTC